jgi:hypothetical protein
LATEKDSCIAPSFDENAREDLQWMAGLAKIDLEWHLSVLEQGFCVERDIKQGKPVYKLTQEGKVVDRLE